MALGSRLHVTFGADVELDSLTLPRRYTLTHSDMTGELFLTIARDYDRKQISGWYTRFMRDEVLGEWLQEGGELSLHLYCHVSGGIIFGTAGMRYNIFRQHMPLVLQAFHEGDAELYASQPDLKEAEVQVHFAAWQKRYRKTEAWGSIGEY
jgi:hypothetical protein